MEGRKARKQCTRVVGVELSEGVREDVDLGACELREVASRDQELQLELHAALGIEVALDLQWRMLCRGQVHRHGYAYLEPCSEVDHASL